MGGTIRGPYLEVRVLYPLALGVQEVSRFFSLFLASCVPWSIGGGWSSGPKRSWRGRPRPGAALLVSCESSFVFSRVSSQSVVRIFGAERSQFFLRRRSKGRLDFRPNQVRLWHGERSRSGGWRTEERGRTEEAAGAAKLFLRNKPKSSAQPRVGGWSGMVSRQGHVDG